MPNELPAASARSYFGLPRSVWWMGGAVVMIVGWYLIHQSSAVGAQIKYALTTVQKGTVVTSVSVTGQVAAVQQLDIRPQASGAVIGIPVNAGDQVKAGDVILLIDHRTQASALQQASASVETAKANLAKVRAGATGPDLAVSQASVSAADISLRNAQKNLENVQAQQDLIVKNSASSLLNGGLAADPGPSNISTVSVPMTGTYTGADTGAYTIRVYASSGGLRFMVNGLESGEGGVQPNLPVPFGSRGLFMQLGSTVHEGDTWTVNVPNTKSSVYLANSNAYQAAIGTRTQATQSAQASVDGAMANLQSAQASLALKQTAAAPEDIAAASAQVSSAEAQMFTAQNNYAATIVRAPFAGRVAAINVHVGDQVGSTAIAASLITPQLMVQAPLNEVDAAKVKIGQKATITFDALSAISLTGSVVQMDILPTVTQGVVNYTVKVAFDVQDDRVKPGMSASVSIVTDVHPDVLTIQNSAVKSQGGVSYVEVFDPATVQPTTDGSFVTSKAVPQQKSVTIGLSNDSVTEILSGLSQGDQVIAQTINPGAKASASANASFRLPGLGGGGGGGGGARVLGR